MSIAVNYHEATKYRPDTIGQSGGLDWDAQPLTHKEYDSNQPVLLADYLPFDPNPFTGRPADADAKAFVPGQWSLAALSQLIFFSYGVTAVVPNEPRNLLLRAAPSAGGLYPAEMYVVVRDCPDCRPGLYGYDPTKHQLVELWPGIEVADSVAACCYGNAAVAAAPILFILSGVFQRSAWRYGERAYRRVLLDTGHVIGNLALVAHACGFRAHVTAAFCDEELNTLLRVDPQDEGALAVIACSVPGIHAHPVWTSLPSRANAEQPIGPIGIEKTTFLQRLHLSSTLPVERPPVIARGEDQADELEQSYGVRGGERLSLIQQRVPLADHILQGVLRRRSTRRYRRGTMTREQLARILAATYHPQVVGLGEQPSLDRQLIMTFIAVLAVDGLATGVYYYAPHSHELRLLKATCERQALQFICLGQELGGDATAVIFHTCDLGRAVKRQGDRAYRYLHLDAGILGERINLAALSEGLGVSGIGGFFDEQVNHLLDIPAEQAVVYITTIGVPAGQKST
jgi:SagB-type dehydrogenase family enzyme